MIIVKTSGFIALKICAKNKTIADTNMKTWEIIKKTNPFFIAEIGLNHNGSFQTAEKMILAAAQCGAHAVKFQTFVPELMNSPFTKDLIENGKNESPDYTIIDFFKNFVFSKEQLTSLKKLSEEKGLIFFSAPFDIPSLNMLENIGTAMYKIASSEITNIPLLKKTGSTKKPVILSTGMANEDEIAKAISILSSHGANNIILLHCVSLYPLEAHEANLQRIVSLKDQFKIPVGISDHGRGIESALIAAALGANVFEKHFKLDHNHDCPDKNVSVTPDEFATMINSINNVIELKGTGEIAPKGREVETAKGARRSLFAANNITTGSIIAEEDLVPLRPGTGIPVSEFYNITGKKAVVDIKKGSLIKYKDIL